ncbi:MAG TPA: LysR substrate-binding domain-containing protein [Usitatibacter sp.]|nr:LysR substrate-binding domain-containing protein [Usitatibacter sp.]
MDYRQLRYFVAVAEELSFSRAARRLHMSQPPLSLQVAAMERELGTRLLERTRRRVELTQAGQVFLEQARVSLAQLERAAEMARRAGQGEAGELRVAFTGSVPMVSEFPRLLSRFRRASPLARVHLMHMATGHQVQALAERRIDVGILRPSRYYEPTPQLRLLPLWTDEMRAVLPEDHRLALRRGPVPVAALAGEPFILFPRELGCGLHEQVMALCSRAGFAPDVVQEAREGATIIGLVAAGIGVSLLPDSYAKTSIPGVVHRRLAAAEATGRLYIAHRAGDTSPLVKRFLELARRLPRAAAPVAG